MRGPRHRPDCTRTRRRPSTPCAIGAAWSSPREPRRESRSATRCRSCRRSSKSDRDTALLLFPTKALAQDQLRVAALVARSRAARRHLRRRHRGPTTARGRARTPTSCSRIPRCCTWGSSRRTSAWATFLMRLQYVVVDELHTLRGHLRIHVAHVLRRLRRLCEHYGSDPTFFFASATIGNPGELASALCGLDVDADRRRRVAARRAGARVLATPVARRALRRARFGEHRDRGAADALRARRATRRSRSPAAGAAPRSSRSTRAVASPGVAPELADRVAAYRVGLPPRGAARARARARRAAGCSASPRPTRSSSASTSAASTRWS